MMMMTMMVVIKMVERQATRDRISVYPTVEKGYQLLSKALSLDNAIQKISLTQQSWVMSHYDLRDIHGYHPNDVLQFLNLTFTTVSLRVNFRSR